MKNEKTNNVELEKELFSELEFLNGLHQILECGQIDFAIEVINIFFGEREAKLAEIA